MKLKHDDIIPNTENPFLYCKLDREKYAKVLTSIVGNYAHGFVLAINNEWGTGKTTFVKMWQKHLEKQGFQTLYFNAWENDFEPNPLVALIAELSVLIKDSSKEKYKSLLEKGALISKNILPHVLKALATRYIGVEAVGELVEDTTQSVTEIFEDEVKDYTTKKEGLKEFRKKLFEFINATKKDKPIVFIIDELDRCRPNYAVELLEQIKHFFSIGGIVFVLSIDKMQLGNAVRGVYGSDRINADEYLRRFIDIEYSIPEPNAESFCNYLYEYFDFDSFFSDKRKQYRDLTDEKEILIKTTSVLFEKAKLSLRQQEKIFAHARIGLTSFKENQYVFPGLYLVLIFIKHFHLDFYLKLNRKQFELDDLVSELFNIIPKGISEYDLNYFVQIEALFVFLYYGTLPNWHKIKLIERNEETGISKSFVKSRLDKSENSRHFVRYLESFLQYDSRILNLSHLLKRIDLVEDVIK